MSKRGSHRVQYPRAALSQVAVDAGLPRHSAAAAAASAAPGAAVAVAAFHYDFSQERRAIEVVECRVAEQNSLEEVRVRAKEAARRLQHEHEVMEKMRKEREAVLLQKQRRQQLEKQHNRQRILVEQSDLALRLLPPDQRRKMEEFRAVTNTDDFDIRKEFLSRYGWRLEAAIAAFFEYSGDVNQIPDTVGIELQEQPAASQPPVSIITFEFPDGSRETAEFKPQDTLWIVFERVYSKATSLMSDGFSLGTASPEQRVFEEHEYDKSLEELGLASQGVIQVASL